MTTATEDVIVVGAGIVGLTVADVLLARGRSVTVLERTKVGDGTSGRSTGKATALHGARYHQLLADHGVAMARRYADAQAAGLDHIAGNAETASSWFQRSPAITYATTEEGRTQLEAELKALDQAGVEARLDEVAALPFATTGALVLDDQGRLDPRGYLDLLAARVAAHPKGSLREKTPVRAVEVGGHPAVELDSASLQAAHVVLATLLPISERGLTSARTTPHMSHCVALELEGSAPTGMYMSVDEPTRSIRRATVEGMDCLVVGGEGHRLGDTPPADVHARLARWAQDSLPVGDVVDRWSTHDHQPHRGLPMAGRIGPDVPVWFATGFGGWGMTNGTAAALVIAEGVAGTGAAAADWHRVFDPSVRGRREVVAALRANASVAVRFGSDRIRSNGPTCSHLGGRCRWNHLDGSWDCPLHGSRFGPTGEVLVAPATRPVTVPDAPPIS
jgi:glycine/D-amino acid oxidase-like deaminating enzyme